MRRPHRERGFVLIASSSLPGQEAPTKGAQSVPPRLKEAEVQALVEQLGGAKEADRQAAMQRLQAAGVTARRADCGRFEADDAGCCLRPLQCRLSCCSSRSIALLA